MLLLHLIDLLLKDPIQFFYALIMLIVPLLVSITFHEWAHGYVAYRFGDPTPKMFGRLTLNPFAHLDPMGTLMLFLVGIGWAKPVPIDAMRILDRTKMMFVAIAGPLSNLLLAFLFSILYVYMTLTFNGEAGPLVSLFILTLSLTVRINLILAIFNMLPIPPFDGSRFFAWLLPEKYSDKYLQLESYAIAIVIFLLFSGGFKYIVIFADFMQSKLIQFVMAIITYAIK